VPANFVLLERTELNASAASVTFANIPQTGYTDLKVVMSTRSADVSNIAFEISVTFNGNTTGYTAKQLFGDGSAAGSSSPTIRPAGFIVGTTATANTFSNGELYIPNYTSSSNKSYSVDSVTETNATTQYMNLVAGLWSNTAAITTIALAGTSGNFAANSTFSLYGLAATGTTPVIAPKASGGNVIATDGTYWYHAFLSNGTFTPATSLSCDVLQIAGGGGGGSNMAGGGGAGGLLAFTSQSLTVTNHTVTIGGGGAGDIGVGSKGVNGTNSNFGALTASVGGGGGGTLQSAGGSSGGSGGGGAGGYINGTGGTGGSATSGQGFSGGSGASGSVSDFLAGAGGGGAGAVGGNGSGSGSASVGGAGGNGVSTYSSWGSATLTGQNISGTYWFAGGAGGGIASTASGSAASGGNGGGGAGGKSNGYLGGANSPQAGLAGTGGGGGGGNNGGTNSTQGAPGGSGIVIIRYAI